MVKAKLKLAKVAVTDSAVYTTTVSVQAAIRFSRQLGLKLLLVINGA